MAELTTERAMKELDEILANAPKSNTNQEQQKLEEELKQPYEGLGKLTKGIVRALEMSDKEIKDLQGLFQRYGSILHIFRTERRVYAVRECTRIEWKKFQVDLQAATTDMAKKMAEKGFSESAIQSALMMYGEEKVAEQFLVYPHFEDDSERRNFIMTQVPGETKAISDAITVALGYGDQMNPIKL